MSTTKNYQGISIGEIVTEDFRTAEIFKNAGIDFCCGGKKTVNEACSMAGVDPHIIIEELSRIESAPSTLTHNFKDWDLAFLCDYIINTHHKYVLKTLPEIVFYTQKIASVHGQHHKELIEVAELTEKISTELNQHLQKEEEVLFPAIKEALKNKSLGTTSLIASEISRMSAEHEFAGGAMDKINSLTEKYRLPDDACNTYKVCFNLMKQFEDDLHIHVHLENNILYPKATKL